jgi:hypothetical protein
VISCLLQVARCCHIHGAPLPNVVRRELELSKRKEGLLSAPRAAGPGSTLPGVRAELAPPPPQAQAAESSQSSPRSTTTEEQRVFILSHCAPLSLQEGVFPQADNMTDHLLVREIIKSGLDERISVTHMLDTPGSYKVRLVGARADDGAVACVRIIEGEALVRVGGGWKTFTDFCKRRVLVASACAAAAEEDEEPEERPMAQLSEAFHQRQESLTRSRLARAAQVKARRPASCVGADVAACRRRADQEAAGRGGGGADHILAGAAPARAAV